MNTFIEGAKIHYPDRGDFAICGSFWLNISSNKEDVTCERCLDKLEGYLTQEEVDNLGI